MADVNCRLLRADFLRAHSLLPNLTNPGLFSATEDYVIPCERSSSKMNVPISSIVKTKDNFQQLLANRPKLMTPVFNISAPAHRVELQRQTEGLPVFAQPS